LQYAFRKWNFIGGYYNVIFEFLVEPFFQLTVIFHDELLITPVYFNGRRC